MSLSEAIAAELPFLRQQAESLMQDTFAIYSPAEVVTGDDGLESQVYFAEGFTIGKIQGVAASAVGRTSAGVNIGGVQREVVHSGLHVPLSSPQPAVGYFGIGWEYECTAVGPLTDPDLLGSRWLVLGPAGGSFKTARRLNAVRLT